MRHKRLNHSADTLCHMLCGWRLANSYFDIEKLGSGTLTIDALSGESKFDGTPIDDLNIAGELHLWLIEDCRANGIPLEHIQHAGLAAELVLSKTSWKNREQNDNWFDADGQKIVTRAINRCVIKCNSSIMTEELEYKCVYDDIEEWPEGFP